MILSSRGVYQSDIIPFEFIHGFTTKASGNMADGEDRQRMFRIIGLDPTRLVLGEQIHGTTIHSVKRPDCSRIIPACDGLVLDFSDPYPVLGVLAADCTPILAVDPVHRVVGVCHSGWKGTLGHIAVKLLDRMIQHGASANDIRLVIGPRICGNCYDVPKERAEKFRRVFGDIVVKQKNGAYVVDIGQAVYNDCIYKGITKNHIDYDPMLCTSCRDSEFYSFRKTTKADFGEIMGFIGFN